MTSIEILRFLNIAEKLKCELRHSWTSSNRQESVAEHSWRLCLFTFILKNEFKDYEMTTNGIYVNRNGKILEDYPSVNSLEEIVSII